MRQSREMPGKHGTKTLILALKESGINVEYVLGNIHQGQNATKNTKDKRKTPTVMVHAGHINEVMTPCIFTEE